MLDTLERGPVLDVEGEKTEQLRQEGNAEEDRGGTVHAPVQQVNEWDHTVSLEHIVPIFPETAEQTDNLDALFNYLAKVLELLFGANQDSLADVDQSWDESQLSKHHQVSLVFELQEFEDFF